MMMMAHESTFTRGFNNSCPTRPSIGTRGQIRVFVPLRFLPVCRRVHLPFISDCVVLLPSPVFDRISIALLVCPIVHSRVFFLFVNTIIFFLSFSFLLFLLFLLSPIVKTVFIVGLTEKAGLIRPMPTGSRKMSQIFPRSSFAKI